MFKPVKAKSIKGYIGALPEERRKPMEFLHKLIQKTAPSLKPNFLYNMPGSAVLNIKTSKKKHLIGQLLPLPVKKTI